MKHKGIICGILAAVCYGTNPLGALPLYAEASVLFFRFSIATVILGVVLIANRKSFAVTRTELTTMASLGALMAASSLTYYQSFHYMDAGIASTILFVYPVMVAVIMATFFREKITATTITSIILALVGIGLLYKGDAGISLSMIVGDGFVADLCRLYCDSQPVEHPYVDIETHVLCAADMHDVSAGLFFYFARLASDVAAISPSMVLCVLVGFGANGSLASIHDHSRS